MLVRRTCQAGQQVPVHQVDLCERGPRLIYSSPLPGYARHVLVDKREYGRPVSHEAVDRLVPQARLCDGTRCERDQRGPLDAVARD
eukprot:1558071-Prymnesium_polylepis.1